MAASCASAKVGHEEHVVGRSAVPNAPEHIRARPSERSPPLGHVESDDVRTHLDQAIGRDMVSRDEHASVVVRVLGDADDDRAVVQLARRLDVASAADPHRARTGVEHLLGHERDVLRPMELAPELFLGLTGNDESALHAAQNLGLTGHFSTPDKRFVRPA
jgi:hypothetical protein